MKLNFSIEREWHKRQFHLFEMRHVHNVGTRPVQPQKCRGDCLRFRFLAAPDLS